MSEDVQMIVDGRTRDINRCLSHLQQGETYYLGLRVRPEHAGCIAALGFSSPMRPGERLLPPARRGAASRRNADGYDIVHRDQPMETAYRQISWTYSQWHGDRQVGVNEVKDVPYNLYASARRESSPQTLKLARRFVPRSCAHGFNRRTVTLHISRNYYMLCLIDENFAK